MLAALGVVLGAFGAHALKGELDEAALTIWQTASRYHLIHALGLVLVGLWMSQALTQQLSPRTKKLLAIAGWCMCAGVLLFSGSLYALALGGPAWIGPITPLGGLFLIGSWTGLFLVAMKST